MSGEPVEGEMELLNDTARDTTENRWALERCRGGVREDLAGISDAALLRRAGEGDPAAFAALHARHASKVRGLAVQIVRDEVTAEDICQEAFLRLWMHGRTYREERGPIGPWLYRIARNLALDEYRRRRSERAHRVIGRSDAPVVVAVVDQDAGPEQRALARALRESLAVGLRELPRPQAEALNLAFLRGLTHREVAAALDQPLGTVKDRIRRGLQALRSDHHLARSAWES
jgi:RNA polymerase sigma-70 factor (ECF subfamily)